MQVTHIVIVVALLFVLVWCFMLIALFQLPTDNETTGTGAIKTLNKFVNSITRKENPSMRGDSISQSAAVPQSAIQAQVPARQMNLHRQFFSKPIELNRVAPPPAMLEPAPMAEIERNMTLYLHTLHKRLNDIAGPTVTGLKAWDTFMEVTKEMPMKWDEENSNRFPQQRQDGSIFVSLGTYRDPFCPMTIKSLYDNARYPERLFVGMFQQNCFGPKCRTGVLKGGMVEDAGPDIDCYVDFCGSPEGIRSGACKNGNVHLFNVNESESLGPYMARYLGAKFYRGEQYYLQIDSHSQFIKDWDYHLIKMVTDAPAEKPVISTYPPDSTMRWQGTTGYRMCDSEFAAAQIEWQIIRLGSSMAFDKSTPDVPKYAPFVAAGFFFGSASFLHEVPFDPFLPWIFMGEEISMSARLWTSGYDIFSPTINVLNHYYVRRHYPKFWESVNRFFKKPIHNDLVEIVINRVKCMLGYPESRPEMIYPNSVLFRQERWGMGKKRSFSQYMKMVGIDTQSKVVTKNQWCHAGEWPELALPYKLAHK